MVQLPQEHFIHCYSGALPSFAKGRQPPGAGPGASAGAGPAMPGDHDDGGESKAPEGKDPAGAGTASWLIVLLLSLLFF